MGLGLMSGLVVLAEFEESKSSTGGDVLACRACHVIVFDWSRFGTTKAAGLLDETQEAMVQHINKCRRRARAAAGGA